jgi:hypothetical protein
MDRRLRQQGAEETERVPGEKGGIAKEIVIPAENIRTDERRFAPAESVSHLGQKGQTARKIVVGEEIAGTPELKQAEKEKDGEKIFPKKPPERS